jgi:UDP-glucose-4-epimerase GalE
MTRHLLVTGGAGFIGSHMVKQLVDAGHRVSVLDNLERGNADVVATASAGGPGTAQLHVGDLHDRDALDAILSDNVDAVIHFAALAYVGESVAHPIEYYRNNVAGTLSLLDAMRDHKVSRCVFSSTCATYGQPDILPITEDTPQHPINAYGQSKLMVEKILADMAAPYSFDSVSLRYFNAAGCSPDASLGERHDPETHLLPLILFEALRVKAGGDPDATSLCVFGDDFPTRDGTCVRDYVHVDDLCSAHVCALDLLFGKPGLGARRYNLGTNRGDTVLEVISACREVTGVDIRYRTNPRRAGDPPELVADASLAMRELGWTPAWPNVRDSIEHAWKWYQTNPPATTAQ